MKSSGSGQRQTASISLILLVLSFWNFAISPFSSAYQQESQTETPIPGATFTPSPFETPLEAVTATATVVVTVVTPITPSIDVPVSSPTVQSTETALPELPEMSGNGDYISNEVLVGFRRRVSKQTMESCIQGIDLQVETKISELSVVLARFPDGKAAETISALQACPGVRYIEPNYEAFITDTIPSDAGWSLQYGLINIRAPQGWDISTGSSNVTIAIVDTGVDLGHLDLAGKIVPGYDFVNNDPIAQDDNGHGTHVAGIAAAASNNGAGVTGVSWGARIMPVKVLNASGNGTFADVAAGITWAADHGAQVMNLSLGGNNSSQVLQDAISYAASKGVVIIAASGNAGSNFVLYPARYPEVIAVAATDGSNVRAGFSNFGPEVDLAAPGVSVYSTLIGGYGYLNGTSMAAPFVSGLAAVLRGIPGNASPSAIAWEMESTALDLGAAGVDDYYGYGLIQMDAALRTVLPAPTVTATDSTRPTPVIPSADVQVSNPGGRLSNTMPPMVVDPTTTSVTPSPTPMTTGSPTFVSTASLTVEITSSAEVFALEGEYPSPGGESQNWSLPCLGIFSILLGVFLFWLARRDTRKYRRR